MALSSEWASPKEFISAVLPSSDMNTYISQNLLYLYNLLGHFGTIVCFDDQVVCYEDNVVYSV